MKIEAVLPKDGTNRGIMHPRKTSSSDKGAYIKQAKTYMGKAEYKAQDFSSLHFGTKGF